MTPTDARKRAVAKVLAAPDDCYNARQREIHWSHRLNDADRNGWLRRVDALIASGLLCDPAPEDVPLELRRQFTGTPAPLPAEIAKCAERHAQAEDEIVNKFGAAYSSRITQDSFGIHQDRATLLRYIKQQPDLIAWLDALERLANAADMVGVKNFDTDTMSDEVVEMQAATTAARNLIANAPGQLAYKTPGTTEVCTGCWEGGGVVTDKACAEAYCPLRKSQ